VREDVKVLLVEDDLELAKTLREALQARGMRVDLAADGPSGFRLASSSNHDVVILDIELPGFDGLEVLGKLREEGSKIPVIMLTAWDEEKDVIRGLDLGADDYLRKPASVPELLARIHSVHRRAMMSSERALKAVDVELDPLRGIALRGGRKIRLTSTEIDLLRVFLSAPGTAISRPTLLKEVWGIEFEPGTNMVAVYVHRLRLKLESKGEPRIIHTLRGEGYLFGEEPEEAR
jgi:DNA-binding response OmpR family regulator